MLPLSKDDGGSRKKSGRKFGSPLTSVSNQQLGKTPWAKFPERTPDDGYEDDQGGGGGCWVVVVTIEM